MMVMYEIAIVGGVLSGACLLVRMVTRNSPAARLRQDGVRDWDW